jgi:hypothetical protein
MGSERQDRREVEFPASFIGDARGMGTVRNLSTSGCKIESPVSVQVDQLLVLRLSIPQESEPVVIDVAAVRWFSEAKFGVEFLKVKADDQRRLEVYHASLSVPKSPTAGQPPS